MAESQEEWKGYKIVRDGPHWIVRSGNRPVGGAFTMLFKARQYVDALAVEEERLEHNRQLKEIKKIPDLKKRSKEYKKLCQTQTSTLPPSQAE